MRLQQVAQLRVAVVEVSARFERQQFVLQRRQQVLAAGAVGLRDLVQRAQDAVDLEQDRARIGFVAQQQVEHRQPLGLGAVARAVGDDAVGQFEQPVQVAVFVHRQRALQHHALELQALEAAPDRHEAPAEVARHAVEREAGQRHQRGGGVVEDRHRLRLRRPLAGDRRAAAPCGSARASCRPRSARAAGRRCGAIAAAAWPGRARRATPPPAAAPIRSRHR